MLNEWIDCTIDHFIDWLIDVTRLHLMTVQAEVATTDAQEAASVQWEGGT